MNTGIYLTPKPRQEQLKQAYDRALDFAAMTADPDVRYYFIQQATALWKQYRELRVVEQDEEANRNGLLVIALLALLAVLIIGVVVWSLRYPLP